MAHEEQRRILLGTRQAPNECGDVGVHLCGNSSVAFLLGFVNAAAPSSLIEAIHFDALFRQSWEELWVPVTMTEIVNSDKCVS